jgi:hypothetical protein
MMAGEYRRPDQGLSDLAAGNVRLGSILILPHLPSHGQTRPLAKQLANAQAAHQAYVAALLARHRAKRSFGAMLRGAGRSGASS